MYNKKLLILLLLISIISNLLANVHCSYCLSIIDDNFVNYNEKIYHHSCFDENIRPKCEKCKMNIDSDYKKYNNKLFHPMCYKNIKFPRCDMCNKQIRDDYFQDLWGNKFHQEHLEQGHKCYYCDRIISEKITNGGYQIEDGRTICSLCESNKILLIEEIEQSREVVLRELNKAGFQNLPTNVKIVMVDQEKLSLYSGKFLPGTISLPNIKGYTKSLDGEYVIYILNNTPLIEFEAILAHEYLHVWQLANNVKINNELSEGVSSLGNFIIYSKYNDKYCQIKLDQMNSSNYIYKNGYLEVKKQITKLGWHQTIENLLNNY